MISVFNKIFAGCFVTVTFLLFGCTSHENKNAATRFPSKGSILLFDTLKGEYHINTSDKKLINAWENFIEVAARMDSSEMSNVSTECIHCPNCVLGEGSPVLSFGEFYKHGSRLLFKDDFISSSGLRFILSRPHLDTNSAATGPFAYIELLNNLFIVPIVSSQFILKSDS